ncbi:MAG: alpha/beta fold hydrolase [Anaerolineales bacterium]|nr:alpha/beta fold hydrolase [Anaerolineales bacterium]
MPTLTPIPKLPRFEPSECQFYPPRISRVECGYLLVPEDRSREDSPIIRMHVAIARSFNDDPLPDPLVYLSGGPGSHSLDFFYGNLGNYTDVREYRDVIFFDPRGVGYSIPSLDCPEVVDSFHETLDLKESSEEWVDRNLEANIRCLERLKNAGISLDAYNSAEMAADVNDLREALGYETMNLFGVSYGTRTALTVMRDFPETLRSVVLDSVVPLELDLLGTDAISADQSLNLVFERCAEERRCSEAFPDLETTLGELFEQLDSNPIIVQVSHLFTNETYDVLVNGEVLGASVVEALYYYETLIYLPKLIYETRFAEDESFETLATSLEIYLLYGDYSSEGMRHAVLCSDEGTFSTLESALDKTMNVHPAIAGYFQRDVEMIFRICEAWGAKVADPIENRPVKGDIPTLVLAGEFDPVTPPEWGQLVADTLDDAYFVKFPGLGHYVFSELRCPRWIFAAFLEDPDKVPDTSCVDTIQFNFMTR